MHYALKKFKQVFKYKLAYNCIYVGSLQVLIKSFNININIILKIVNKYLVKIRKEDF